MEQAKWTFMSFQLSQFPILSNRKKVMPIFLSWTAQAIRSLPRKYRSHPLKFLCLFEALFVLSSKTNIEFQHFEYTLSKKLTKVTYCYSTLLHVKFVLEVGLSMGRKISFRDNLRKPQVKQIFVEILKHNVKLRLNKPQVRSYT